MAEIRQVFGGSLSAGRGLATVTKIRARGLFSRTNKLMSHTKPISEFTRASRNQDAANSTSLAHPTSTESKGWLTSLRQLPRSTCVLALGLAALGLSSGCVAVVAGAGAGGAVAYTEGKLTADLSADVGRTVQATRDAMGQLQFALVSDRSDALNGEIIARTSEDKKVDIELSKAGDNVTHVKIRVGTFGNSEISLAILNKIKANLGL
jgi:hypothetical protein